MNYYNFTTLKTQAFLKRIAELQSPVEHIQDNIAISSVQELSVVEQFIYARFLINQHYVNQGADIFATNEDTQLYSMGSSSGENMILLAQEPSSVAFEYESLINVDGVYPIGYIVCENSDTDIGVLRHIELQLPSISRLNDSDADYATSIRLQLDENYKIQGSDNSEQVDSIIAKYKYLLDAICDFLKDKPLDVCFSCYPPATRIESIDNWISTFK
ncbi:MULTISPECIES: hypothetical protein [Acinetobacter]|uniref:hypothetical protein n=1 Tax=Acinetobacter TaxID=469 RepID=UPI0005137706|nr:hypothetical protein [Acinetobacter radioresistens]KGH50020.1 hypothetical protein GS19_10165 [Acinetobacter idrijaensis]PSD34404.1 hypothetical protein C7E16_15125 [Acinetobacter radioresistens]PSD36743.1 hypothetical protein C7E21_12045 [Acinetobacter radioresistens]